MVETLSSSNYDDNLHRGNGNNKGHHQHHSHTHHNHHHHNQRGSTPTNGSIGGGSRRSSVTTPVPVAASTSTRRASYDNAGGAGGKSNNGSHSKMPNATSTTTSSSSGSSGSGSQSNSNQNVNGGSGGVNLLEKLTYDLNNDPMMLKEFSLGKLIGFYKILDEIGNGNFSKVKLGVHLLTKEKVAIKILDKTKLDDKTQRLLLREISSMERLHHPNIIRLYEVIQLTNRLYICMEYAPDGELYTKISEQGKLNEADARHIFSQIVSAIDHMHANKIIHRDIKAENVFFASNRMVKVGDFGFSIHATPEQQLNTYCGSPPYAAPELFRDDHYVGIYVDIWALGVLLYFMVTAYMPFKADTVGRLKRAILNGEFVIPSFVSEPCRLLIRGILKPIPSERYALSDIMDSAWLDGYKFTPALEPYQLSPCVPRSDLLKVEVRTREILEKLGITENYLIYSNYNNSGHLHHPHQHYNHHKHLPPPPGGHHLHHVTRMASIPSAASMTSEQHEALANIVSSTSLAIARVIASSQPPTIISATGNRQTLTMMPAQISLEQLKQSINGTYRIVFHRLQKEFSHEVSGKNFSHMSQYHRSKSVVTQQQQQQQQQQSNKQYQHQRSEPAGGAIIGAPPTPIPLHAQIQRTKPKKTDQSDSDMSTLDYNNNNNNNSRLSRRRRPPSVDSANSNSTLNSQSQQRNAAAATYQHNHNRLPEEDDEDDDSDSDDSEDERQQQRSRKQQLNGRAPTQTAEKSIFVRLNSFPQQQQSKALASQRLSGGHNAKANHFQQQKKSPLPSSDKSNTTTSSLGSSNEKQSKLCAIL